SNSTKPSPQVQASNPPPPTTTRPPTTANPPVVQIVPGLPHDEALHNRLSTEQLLQATDQNLGSIRRPLTASEQEIVQQIRVYVQQSRTASGNGDQVMARNLAVKAHLLSDELVRP